MRVNTQKYMNNKNIILRELEFDDAKFFFKENIENVRDSFFEFNTIEDAKEWIKEALIKIKNKEKEEWVAEIGGKQVGSIGINYINNEPQIGMWVPTHLQNKKIGESILKKIIEIIRERNYPKKLYYYADSNNESSNKLAFKCWFSLVTQNPKENKYILIF